MPVLSKATEIVRVLGEIARVLPAATYKLAKPDEQASLGAKFEDSVARYSHNTMLLFEDQQWTYAEFNEEVNRLAHLLTSRGLKRGDTLALFMENRMEYVLSMLAMAKLGVHGSLLNSSLTGAALVHCIKATDAKGCIVGEERTEALAEVLEDLEFGNNERCFWFPDKGSAQPPGWAINAREAMAPMPVDNPAQTRDIRAGETAFYIYTSGTTGLPKAAVVKHWRILAAGHGLGRLGFQIKPQDRLYLCLPIYHITGLGPGLCGFIGEGASIVLRRGFSASKFWPEIKEHQANCFIYVGELCRYLMMQPACPEELENPLQKMLGNGLRPDVWDGFKSRFGVRRICEIYGSSEGNITFANLLNMDRTIGTTFKKVALVQYDNENDQIVRDADGRCLEVAAGEAGLLIGKITDETAFDGYTDTEASSRKVVRDAFVAGDSWFNSGDLVRQTDVGFTLGIKHYQFVDRTGDTFRWRAENVSTNEVAEVINAHSQIDMANVYGVEVPGVEGRAGMLAFALDEGIEFDFEQLRNLVERELPLYARPVFVRLQRSVATTVTFKLLKGELREQAFHLDKVGEDSIYVCKPRSTGYELLDTDFYQHLLNGTAGY